MAKNFMLNTIFSTEPQKTLFLGDKYQQVRQTSEQICQPLEIEDYVVQSMPDASPLKWHLAHTAWFFEVFILVPHLKGYKVFHPKYDYLLNSYYESKTCQCPQIVLLLYF